MGYVAAQKERQAALVDLGQAIGKGIESLYWIHCIHWP
jgi:hypothetical protein